MWRNGGNRAGAADTQERLPLPQDRRNIQPRGLGSKPSFA
jgi:hypothetical protein